MAVTKIWAIKGRINNVINYAVNPEKTGTEFSKEEFEALHDVVKYAADELKTEKLFYVSALNCELDRVCEQMLDTKREYGKTGGIIAFHGYQSFIPGEVTPALAHKIGCELAEKLWGDRFEVVVATHLNTNACHNHFVVNSVSCVDGKKFYASKKTYREMREESDALCKKYGLHVVVPSERSKTKSYPEYKAEKNGAYTKNSVIKRDIDECIASALALRQFFEAMNDRGYIIDDTHKYMTVTHPAFAKPRRFKTLGDGYTEEDIQNRILSKWQTEQTDIPKQEKIEDVFFDGDIKSAPQFYTIREVYTRFSFGLRIVCERPNTNRALQYLLGDEIIKLDKIIAETNFMNDNNIESAEQIETFKKKIQSETDSLTEARQVLRNSLKAAVRRGDTKEQAQLQTHIAVTSERLQKLRRDKTVCERISERTPQIKNRMTQIKELSERQNKEVIKSEQRRRRRGTNRANES